MPFEFHKTEIEGVLVITPHMYPDERGLYKKCYEKMRSLKWYHLYI